VTVQGPLLEHMEATTASDLAELLSQGVWTHDHPLTASVLEQLGLPVRVGVPAEERTLMDLYPQPRGRQALSSTCPAGLPRRRLGATNLPVVVDLTRAAAALPLRVSR
jgi:hypothetical protein